MFIIDFSIGRSTNKGKNMSKQIARGWSNVWVIYFLVVMLLIWTLAPIYVTFISSILVKKELTSIPPHWIPTKPTFENYLHIFAATEIGGTAYLFKRSLLNSFVVAGGVSIFCLFVGGLAAYAFSRFDIPFKDKVLFLVLFTQMLPIVAVVIPLYLIASHLHMLDKRITLIIVYSSFTLPLVIWILKGFFDTISPNLEEAAMIDGCTLIGAFLKVVVPLSLPGLVATGAIAFIGAWNEFMIALVFTSSMASKTAPVAISEFIGRFRVDYGLMCTVGILASALPLGLALIFQRHLVQGLSSGGVKG